MDSVFTKIIKREIPANILYEDEHTIAILDIHPVLSGHTLIISKEPYERWERMDVETAAHVWATAKLMTKQLYDVLRVDRVCVKIEGFDVPHVHIVLLPCNSPEDFMKPQETESEPDWAALLLMRDMLRLGEY
jgi:histidine triad (HIT) family protein